MGMHEALVYLGLAEDKPGVNRDDVNTREIRIDDVSRPAEQPAPRRAEVTPIKRERAERVVAEPMGAEVTRISTIHPSTYNDAKSIGEAFREGVPVIMNLSEMDDSDAKRLVDFSAGLIFGLHGSIERVTAKVFLLTPANVEVTKPQPPGRAAPKAGFFNQS
ncbi:MAG: cell division protein SepF [Actinomycetales bacterium]